MGKVGLTKFLNAATDQAQQYSDDCNDQQRMNNSSRIIAPQETDCPDDN